MRPRITNSIWILIGIGSIQVALCGGTEPEEPVIQTRLGDGKLFELTYQREQAPEEAVSNDSKVFDLRKLAPPSAFASNDVFVAWIRSNTNGRRVPVWTNSQPTFDGLAAAKASFRLLAVEGRTNILLLCYKVGPLAFGETVGLGSTSSDVRKRSLLYRDHPSSSGGNLTNAVFHLGDGSTPQLTTADSLGTEFTWTLERGNFSLTNTKTSVTNLLQPIRLPVPEHWVWRSNRWHTAD